MLIQRRLTRKYLLEAQKWNQILSLPLGKEGDRRLISRLSWHRCKTTRQLFHPKHSRYLRHCRVNLVHNWGLEPVSFSADGLLQGAPDERPVSKVFRCLPFLKKRCISIWPLCIVECFLGGILMPSKADLYHLLLIRSLQTPIWQPLSTTMAHCSWQPTCGQIFCWCY